jgi:glycosyltransferase involved in cell wall biosynthesis
MPSTQPALLDVRWLLGIGGIARVGQHIIAGLGELDPPGFNLVLWGEPGHIGDHPDWCRIQPTTRVGCELYAQRELFDVPAHSGGLYLQQQRPLRDWRTATIIHDTIQLRAPSDGVVQKRLRAAFLGKVARRSQVVLTVSEHARLAIERDLGRAASDITRLRLPMDVHLAAAVRSRRSELAADPTWRPNDILFVGRMGWNKNVDGLLRATAMASPDCTLRIFGARGHERDEIRRNGAAAGVEQLDVSVTTSESALVDAYANARAVVLPSFEEGWGLPVWEAIACGIPVVASTGGSLPELAPFSVAPFQSVDVTTSDEPLAEAISIVSDRGAPDPERMNVDSLTALQRGPTRAELARDILDAIAKTRA